MINTRIRVKYVQEFQLDVKMPTYRHPYRDFILYNNIPAVQSVI